MEARDYQTIRVTSEASVATLTLSIPERKNPLGPVMVNELLYALDDARDDPQVRVVVLTGAGKAFSAGGDLKQMGTSSALESKGDYSDLLLRFPQLHKPTVARVPGYAMGGGLGLVASCDFAVACESAVLGTPEIKRGLFPMMIMAVLQQVMPRRELMNMMLLGERLTAAEAKRAGLLSQVVGDGELDEVVDALTRRLAGQSPTAMARGLRAFHGQREQSLAMAIPKLRDELFSLLGTEDAREGLTAFFEKRDPVWKGR